MYDSSSNGPPDAPVSGSLFFAGDVLCQALERSSALAFIMKPSHHSHVDTRAGSSDWDIARACRMGIFGFAFIGPFSVYWYNFLDAVRATVDINVI
jgi:hypothetical protein